ncbi:MULTISPECIES: hypothetical protein [unclassified Haladaptatus]|uniref:hypothetical protein n=1 Tax=unclassified Haladaptatus TaxID=2622732 RepID=UPI0023E8B9FD|nr:MULTISPECIES: hypothetical protein [unclassified Haladaptatus]
MRTFDPRRHGLATLGLGLSILFAVAAFAYFALSGAYLQGAALGILVIAAGIWEYRRKVQDEIVSKTYEAEAETQNQRSQR